MSEDKIIEPIVLSPSSPQDLWPGDIIFWHSRSWLSRIIQKLDGTPWNHTSVVVSMTNDAVFHAESEKHGVVISMASWETITKPDRTKIVRPAPNHPEVVKNVVATINSYIGLPYAAHTLALLAVVLLAKDGKLPRFFGRIFAWLARRGGKTSLICSELSRRMWRDAGYNVCKERPDLTTPGDLWRGMTG